MVKKKKLSLAWSKDSKDRLKNIYNWNTENHTIKRAKKILGSIKSVARKIPSNPYSHPKCFEIEEPNENIRKALVKRTYWIVYEIEDDRVVILEVIHGRMDPEIYKKIK